MTLEKTWKECLRMWKWIVEEGIYILDDNRISELKEVWLSINEYGILYNNCFFCDYAETHDGDSNCGSCINCPVQEVDKDFCCQDDGTHWSNNPIEFYEKLVKLNKKRPSKKGKR